ncbi:unnamed protein product, partial [Ilex paraguariensis]
ADGKKFYEMSPILLGNAKRAISIMKCILKPLYDQFSGHLTRTDSKKGLKERQN